MSTNIISTTTSNYFRLGSAQGRSELHSKLSVIVYRYSYTAPSRAQLGFSGRYNLIEDFLQDFYAESLNAFRRENEVAADYQPRTRLEIAEYMAFTEQYAKRSITLPDGYSQQLIIVQAQTFAQRLQKEALVDTAKATEFSEEDSAEDYSSTMQQARAQLVSFLVGEGDDSQLNFGKFLIGRDGEVINPTFC